jgi:hypothetical protein
MQGFCDEARKVLSMRLESHQGMYAAIGHIVGSNPLVEQKLCTGSEIFCKWRQYIGIFRLDLENCNGCLLLD